YDSGGTGTGTYATWLLRMNNPPGCTPIAYGDAPVTGSIGAAVETDCYRFSGSNGDKLRLRVVKTSGTMIPLIETVRPDGTTLCGATTAQVLTCTLTSNGNHAVVVRDFVGTSMGGYSLVIQRLNNPVGCASIAYGAGKTGNISAADRMDCFTRASVGVGDVLRFRTAETGGSRAVDPGMRSPHRAPHRGPHRSTRAPRHP